MTSKRDDLSLSWLELVVLARYSSPKAPSPAELGKVLLTLALPSDSASQGKQKGEALVNGLCERGLLAIPVSPGKTKTRQRSLALTEAGGQALRNRLSLSRTPSWNEVRDVHLPSLSLNLRIGSPEASAAVKTWETVTIQVLSAELGIPRADSLNSVGDALILEALGLSPGPMSIDRLRMGAFARRAGVPPKGTYEELAKRVVVSKLDARNSGKDALLPALTRRWLTSQADHSLEIVASLSTPMSSSSTVNPPPVQQPISAKPASAKPESSTPIQVPPAPTTLPQATPNHEETLLKIVREVIPQVGAEGRFGMEKVFVSAIWRGVERDRRLGNYSFERFKKWLLTANRSGHLALARADLVSAMDAKLVSDSEIQDQGATFHFVLDQRASNSHRRPHVR